MRELYVAYGFAALVTMSVFLAIHRSKGGPQFVSWGLRALAVAVAAQGARIAWQNLIRLGEPIAYEGTADKVVSFGLATATAVGACVFFAAYINTRFWPDR